MTTKEDDATTTESRSIESRSRAGSKVDSFFNLDDGSGFSVHKPPDKMIKLTASMLAMNTQGASEKDSMKLTENVIVSKKDASSVASKQEPFTSIRSSKRLRDTRNQSIYASQKSLSSGGSSANELGALAPYDDLDDSEVTKRPRCGSSVNSSRFFESSGNLALDDSTSSLDPIRKLSPESNEDGFFFGEGVNIEPVDET